MAKKKISGPKQIWFSEDQVELIAWLDHSLRHEINFANTIVGHLKRSRGKDFTLAQVNTKLRYVWYNFGSNNYSVEKKNWKDVFQYGSEILPLGDEVMNGIVLALERLEKEKTAALFSPRRRLRSASALDDCLSSPLISLETVDTTITPKRRCPDNNTRTASVTPLIAKRECDSVDIAAQEAFTPSKRPKKASQSKPTSLPSPDSYQRTANKIRRSTPTVLKVAATDAALVVDDNERESYNIEGELEGEGDVNEAIARLEEGREGKRNEVAAKLEGEDGKGNGGAADENEEEATEEDDKSPGSSDVSSLNGSTDSHNFSCDDDSYNFSSDDDPLFLDEQGFQLKNKTGSRCSREAANQTDLDAAFATIRKLRKQLRQNISALHQKENEVTELRSAKFQSSHEPCAKILEKDRHIKMLRRELKDRETLGTFTKLLQDSHATFGKTGIEEAFGQVYFQVKNILYRGDGQKQLFIPSLDRYSDLRLLVWKSLSIDSQATITTEDISCVLSRLSPEVVVRALTTSALREWVFENDLPRFGGVQELLVKYRESLAKLDGAVALRNLDLAAHSSIINNDEFRNHRIPKKARELAIRLSKALAPFFVKDPDDPMESDVDGFRTWGQEQEEWKERKLRLVNIFSLALKIKADSLLNIQDYGMVTYAPGTPFDKDTMNVESIEGLAITPGNTGGQVIELCIEAAVFSCPKKRLDDDSNFMDAVVNPRYLSRIDDGQREDVKLLLRAVVILKDEKPAIPQESAPPKEPASLSSDIDSDIDSDSTL